MGFNILPVGIRTMYKGEYDYAKEKNLKYFEWGRADIPTPSVDEVLAAITTDKVYLTVDIDGFDPSVAPATGTPVPGGLSWEFGETLVREICKKKTVISADIVEVAPNEFSGQTQYAAAQLAYHVLTLHMHTK
jgi:agmatinase